MKKASGSIRIDLAQAREMESFTQFSSDLDEATREQLKYGAVLTELLKQPLGVDMEDYESLQYFQRVLIKSGIIEELERMGIHEGDTVSILNFEFDYIK